VIAAQARQTGTAQSLLSAVRQKKWKIAFRLAYQLKRRDISPSERRTLEYFELQASRFAMRALKSGNVRIAQQITTALYTFRNMKLPTPEIVQKLKSEIRGLQLNISHLGRYRDVKSRSGSRTGSAPGRRPGARSGRNPRTGSVELHRGGKSASPHKIQAGAKQQKDTKDIETVERIPHMEFQENGPEKFTISVFANTEPADDDALVQALTLKIPKKMKQFTVAVSFECSVHFRLEASNSTELIFLRNKPESSRASCSVTLILPDDSSPMFLTALFRHNGRPSGKITRFLGYDGQQRQFFWKKPPPVSPNKPNQEIILPKHAHSSNIPFDDTNSSDIRIEVRNPTKDGRSFQLECYTPAGDWKGFWNLPTDSKEFVKTHMDSFMASKENQTLAKLQAAGIDFWDSVTEEARDCLKKAFASHPISTISVLSEEPYIPWELMVPVPKGSAPVPCLGVRYSMGRWITGDFRSPVQSIPMRTAFIVAPKESGLKSAPGEAKFINKIFPGSTQIKPVNYKVLDKKLKTTRHKIVHFICHGETAGFQTLQLDSDDLLNSSEVIAMEGFRAAFQKGPFAFLNACEVGEPVRALAGLGGFANSFLHLGASAVVAPLWSVDDSVASKVCKSFYHDVLAGKTFGEAMRRIRARAFSEGKDTYASYCYYGDPAALAVQKADR
jgi:hypothetical protein